MQGGVDDNVAEPEVSSVIIDAGRSRRLKVQDGRLSPKKWEEEEEPWRLWTESGPGTP